MSTTVNDAPNLDSHFRSMNRLAYRTTGLVIKAIAELSKANIRLHGVGNIPQGALIFVINHFTRLETLLMPYQIYKLTHTPVWSLASVELFKGFLGTYLNQVGALSTKDPDRDRLIVKTLLTGEACWIIFPEGRMVKNKKIIEKGRFMISYAGGKHPPHSGAATLALRTEFYRQRLRQMQHKSVDEVERIKALLELERLEEVTARETFIVPVNLTYYPLRVQENLLSNMAVRLVEDIPDRIVEEIMTEGTMLLSGVDVDIRFGNPIEVSKRLKCRDIQKDIASTQAIGFNDALPSRRCMRREALKTMQDYMQAIYGMTTVNYDHLFASILKALPKNEIPADELRQRVFWLVRRIRKEHTIHRHPSLEDDQTHLLTDDRYQHVRNFTRIAIEKGLLQKLDGGYRINRRMLVSPWDFHRIRIDNPIEVMANAVEPLKILQRHVRTTAWMPAFWLRRKIAEHLVRRDLAQFEADYHRYYVKGESKVRSVGMPNLIRGRRRDIGVVLVHGYMAAPQEMSGLADYLAKRHVWVYNMRVAGHGTSPEDLARCTISDWRNSVDRAFAIMQHSVKRVVVGGFSNGAGLALDLAARTKNLSAVFAICPPLKLKDISAKLVPAVDIWNRLMKRVHIDDVRMDFIENHPENPHINYLRNPISGVRELERLMDAVEPTLPDIRIPALVIQASNDPVVNPKGSRRVFQRLGTSDKQYVLLNAHRHGIVLGKGSDAVHRLVWEFVSRIKGDFPVK